MYESGAQLNGGSGGEDELAPGNSSPYVAAARGYVDDVIDPRDTRPKVIHALEMLRSKTDSVPPKKHSNLPL